MKIKILIVGVIISIIYGCSICKEITDNFIYCYDGKRTGIDSILNIDGYYSMNHTMNQVFSYNNDEKSIGIGDCMFFKDGFFIYSFQPSSNDGLCGSYILRNDTIKAQFITNTKVEKCYIEEIWFQIIDKNRIKWLGSSAFFKMTENNVKELKDKQYYPEPYKFIPLESFPNPDRLWIKRKNFFWCDKEKYKEYMAKLKEEKRKKKK